MEAITIAGIAVVLVGGFYSVVDLLNDLGIRINRSRFKTEIDSTPRSGTVTAQSRVKKMAGVHI